MGEQKILRNTIKFPYQAKAYSEDIKDYIYKHDTTLKGENESLAAYYAD